MLERHVAHRRTEGIRQRKRMSVDELQPEREREREVKTKTEYKNKQVDPARVTQFDKK